MNPKYDNQRKTIRDMDFWNMAKDLNKEIYETCENKFYAIPETAEENSEYIKCKSEYITRIADEIPGLILKANSIFPNSDMELHNRRVLQEVLIGETFDLTAQFEMVYEKLKIPNSSHNEIFRDIDNFTNKMINWKKATNKMKKYFK